MIKVNPIIICGGFGTRLWPLSRRAFPKQFVNFFNDESLFQSTVSRLVSTNSLGFTDPIIVSNSEYKFIINNQMADLKRKASTILIEPEPKGTAAAILSACLHKFVEAEDAILLVTPSDHFIPDVIYFNKCIADSLPAVQHGKMVTFGIKPRYPETGYGYIKTSNDHNNLIYDVLDFVEKPDYETAVSFMKSEDYLWNSGIFLLRASDMIHAFEKFDPDTLEKVRKATTAASEDLNFLSMNEASWGEISENSIDYAIMEKADNLAVFPYEGSWTDMGSWQAVSAEMNSDHENVALSHNAMSFDCKNTMLRSEDGAQTIVGVGLEDIFAVAMRDAVLIAHKDKSQDIKGIVDNLKSSGVEAAENFPKVHRPWGWYERLLRFNRFQVKRIQVNPQGILSLQSHFHRSEHWVVVSGTAQVTIDGKDSILSEGQSTYIPLGVMHRLQNPGKLPLILIEVQIGAYLDEDDIVRYDDIYKRF